MKSEECPVFFIKNKSIESKVKKNHNIMSVLSMWQP